MNLSTRLNRCRFVAAALLVLAVLPLEARERILSFHSDVTVNADGSMIVTETITVRSEQNQIKRGIYRDFPTTYESESGTVKVDFDVFEVLRDGEPEPHHSQSHGNGVRLYIGAKDRILPPREYTYEISYYTDRQIGFFEAHDELYWNVTGNAWAFPIDRASARIAIPGGLSFSGDLEAYTGPHGARGTDYRSRIDENGAAVFETTRALDPKEGLTVVVSWPPGAVARPSGTQKMRYFLRDNAALVASVGGFLLLLSYYLLSWWRVGRDPESGVVIARFKPPRELSPAAVRYIHRMSYDHDSFTAALINIAVKGYITISQDDDQYMLHRRGDGWESLSTGERQLATQLFSKGDTLILTRTNHKTIRSAIRAHKIWLRNEYHKLYFKTNGWYLVPGILISLLVLLVAGFNTSGGSVEFMFMGVWLSAWTFTVFVLLRQRRKLMAVLFAVIDISVFAGFLGATDVELGVLLVCLIAVNVLFYYLIKAPTDSGRELLDEIEGLKMYLAVAEEDRLNVLNPPEQTLQHFETLLPYALALGVDQAWSERFAAHLSAAATDPQDSSYRPNWYRGNRFRDLDTARFSSSLGSSLSRAISASSTAPGSSSGSSGGGSSGGGGGGGGGGGW